MDVFPSANMDEYVQLALRERAGFLKFPGFPHSPPQAVRVGRFTDHCKADLSTSASRHFDIWIVYTCT